MDGALRTWVTRLPLVVLAVLAAGFLALGLAEVRADAPTFDEPVYVSRPGRRAASRCDAQR